MAVYRRRYQATAVAARAPRFRFLVFARYALRDLFALRVFALYFVSCFAAPLVGAVIIYLHYNALGLKVLETSVRELLPIDAAFFLRFLMIQTGLGSLLAALVGPGLVAPDLANNALPLYLSRPISRADYVLGKLTVLLGLMSVLTWVPIMLLFALQSGLAGWSWFAGNLRIAFGIVACSLLWMLVVSLLTLAVSAWVRWRPVATLAVFGYFFISAAIGSFICEELHATWGGLLDVIRLMSFIWSKLFGVEAMSQALPLPVSVAAIVAWCLVFLVMLVRRVRAFEVVRG
jgi:ABC-2 type transport system permease protein